MSHLLYEDKGNSHEFIVTKVLAMGSIKVALSLGLSCANLLPMEPETWNREELYKDVWEQPLTKLQSKYGVSNVAIGKACRKLKVPLPGRGYWAKLVAGHKVKQVPLPEYKDAPVVQRMKTEAAPKPTTDSSDPELAKIANLKSHALVLRTEQHKLVESSAGLLRRARTDDYGRTEPPPERTCLNVRVSKELLDRALAVMGTIIFALEDNGFPVKTEQGLTSAHIFGQDIKFAIREDLRVKENRKAQGLAHTYERNGNLVFEVSAYAEGCRKRWADGKTQRVETMLSDCVAGLMLVARTVRIWQEGIKRRHEEWDRQERKRAEYKRLSEEIDTWMAGWQKAKQIREFVAAVENVCKANQEPTSPDSPRGKWIRWALRHADAFDPLVPNEETEESPESE
jgi:hypothetical protein